MVLTPSTMMPLGSRAPDFSLKDVLSGKVFSLKDIKNKKAFLLMFICRHCPYVQHVTKEISILGRDYQNKDIGIAAISSNDPEAYPEDAPASLSEMARELNFTFPYLFDESQETAKKYKAACTPDFFLFDKERKLAYRGQLDDSRPANNIPVTGKDLRGAIEAVLNDTLVNPDQKPSIGCNIKWKSGNEPNYQ
ncbi:alkyl hydroperoxide reductase [Candidatus Gottesmanbacteria bacterium RIFCSPHIGHO2_02_FULL_40_24]|uniref:Alkyl hydroperoxide reductase n=1 Tax=Candidatus Gottesmanbacteria bacterium RIFCSPHIGHO2_01_FULL_40_15 TaxID=1798376 RepID=A0A1F5Z4A0_9BACT|nr:MAG: alkyl hydroperoxide reductase [Candidatus Gottesmanbacteria bacterium RIFCSPHIGHO2_01_FULL_40_15]OGG17895.1 MAG: alkyl hydroperoxide reductase [Candidatus Gottesmanbacteria bacterium RIFCSPHIGHO2_02_FULL_40_24]OGG21761.1 MAG: alkyl hydroperoxide reductase [Candidatus Gottesmanbacteria bacterium RIFCSPLOWO2_01_FULL_40_10]OGG24735.1 MAG: alkyl hydroperoxide reductase [Candidatus Gottesmanbacteria bacterium RIFCSPHIGHO2_12_FULL_40_13]